MRAFLAVGLGQVVAAMGPGTMPAPAYDASANGECDRPSVFGPVFLSGSLLAAPAPAPVSAPVPQGVGARAGGFFGKERHIPPAAGKQPHITFILMDD